MPLFFRFNAVNAAIFPVQRRQRRYFSGSTPLSPLFSGSTPLSPLFFRFNAVKSAIFRFNAVNAAIFAVKCR